jgi:hypothetical protein
MAITKTTKLQRCEVYPAADSSEADTKNEHWPVVVVSYEDHLDDASDDDLPVVATRVKYLSKFTVTTDGEGVETSADTVINGEDALVQTICTAVWA